MQNKICAIHQPNFFPWLGYFDKIRKCDKFVILDDVQFPKTGGGGWSNRVAINIQGQAKWITAPIIRPSGLWNINETIFQSSNWRDKIIKTLQANYSKTPYFKENKDFIFELISFDEDNLSKYNINAIVEICKYLNVDTRDKLVLSSNFFFNSSSNELLIDLTKTSGCNTYMAGGGADGYQDLEVFKKANINFIYQDFKHPVYKQFNANEFINGLSVIDYIFNVGNNYG